jgi:hypothetical protein
MEISEVKQIDKTVIINPRKNLKNVIFYEQEMVIFQSS